jgi:cell division septation protein DedD
MADEKDQNQGEDFEDLDEDFDLDLFADEEQDQSSRTEPELSPAEEDFEAELQGDFDPDPENDPIDDFADELDDDVIDISDDEIAEELAAMEQEDVSTAAVEADPAPAPAPEAGPEVTEMSIPEPETASPTQAPAETEAEPEETGPAVALPPFLASLSSVSPRMIVAGTAAVLLPVVVFAVLGINSDSSGALEDGSSDTAAAGSAENPFIQSSDGSIERDSDTVNVPDLSAEDIEPALAATRREVNRLGAEQEINNGAESALSENQGSESQSDDTESRSSESSSPDSQTMVASQDPLQEREDSGPDSPGNENMLLAQTEAEQAADQADTDMPVLDTTESSAEAQTTTPTAVAVTSEDNEEEAPANNTANSASSSTPSTASSTASDIDIPGTAEGRNYHVIVASFVSAADANCHASSITDSEISAYVIPPFGSSSNYRVAVANYRSMAEARENIPGLQALFGSGIWPLRYPPSPGVPLISSRSGATYIIVASFPNEQLARSHAGQLVQRGEQPAIIAPYPPANRYRVAASYYDSLENAETALPQFRQNYGADAWLLRY